MSGRVLSVRDLEVDPLKAWHRPKNSQLVEAQDIEIGDLLWAMSERPFRVTHITSSESVVILRSQGHSKESRAQNMVLLAETKLVRLKSEHVGGAG